MVLRCLGGFEQTGDLQQSSETVDVGNVVFHPERLWSKSVAVAAELPLEPAVKQWVMML